MGNSSSQNPKGPACSLPSCPRSHPQVTEKEIPEKEWQGTWGKTPSPRFSALVTVSSGRAEPLWGSQVPLRASEKRGVSMKGSHTPSNLNT